MTTGYAKNTSGNQYWLNSCQAVTAWIELDDNWLEFQSEDGEVNIIVPPGIYFGTDAIGDDEPAIPAIYIDFERLRSCLQQRGADDGFDLQVEHQALLIRECRSSIAANASSSVNTPFDMLSSMASE